MTRQRIITRRLRCWPFRLRLSIAFAHYYRRDVWLRLALETPTARCGVSLVTSVPWETNRRRWSPSWYVVRAAIRSAYTRPLDNWGVDDGTPDTEARTA